MMKEGADIHTNLLVFNKAKDLPNYEQEALKYCKLILFIYSKCIYQAPFLNQGLCLFIEIQW